MLNLMSVMRQPAFYRGCAQGLLTGMYWLEIITEEEYKKMVERIRRSITLEEDCYVEK